MWAHTSTAWGRPIARLKWISSSATQYSAPYQLSFICPGTQALSRHSYLWCDSTAEVENDSPALRNQSPFLLGSVHSRKKPPRRWTLYHTKFFSERPIFCHNIINCFQIYKLLHDINLVPLHSLVCATLKYNFCPNALCLIISTNNRDLTFHSVFPHRDKLYCMNRKLEGSSYAVESVSSDNRQELSIMQRQLQHSEASTGPKANTEAYHGKLAGDNSSSKSGVLLCL